MGTLYWITGPRGTGKTTIAKELYGLLRKMMPNIVFLDGDILREVFRDERGYTKNERLNLALKYARLSKMLITQDINVVCSTISLFKECHQWNRENIINYNEIYLKVSMDVLRARDRKEIYSRAEKGEIKNIVGIDMPFDEPENPDLVINNDGSETPEGVAKRIYEHFNKK